MILRIGVGEYVPKQKGYKNVDIRPLPNIDVVADAKVLPFKDGKVDGIESRNLVEHFSRFEIKDALKEWARVLKKDGYMLIETVDMGLLMDNWRKIPTENWLDGVLGAQTYPENFHKMSFTLDSLTQMLADVGCEVVKHQQWEYRQIPRMAVVAIKT